METVQELQKIWLASLKRKGETRMERETVVNAIAYLRKALEAENLLCNASLLLLNDVADYLAFSQSEKEQALGYMNCKAIEQWQSQRVTEEVATTGTFPAGEFWKTEQASSSSPVSGSGFSSVSSSSSTRSGIPACCRIQPSSSSPSGISWPIACRKAPSSGRSGFLTSECVILGIAVIPGNSLY